MGLKNILLNEKQKVNLKRLQNVWFHFGGKKIIETENSGCQKLEKGWERGRDYKGAAKGISLVVTE